ncbi:MAG: hypothetical protein LUC37_02730 [Prevotella sp.]|nr:hypothetical protein [Prevotella sp.]
MTYDFNGKKLKIPDDDIKKSMQLLDLTQEEAIQMWLEDEGYLENEEQELLEQKAKANRITATIHEARADYQKKTQKERVQKPDPAKEQIIQKLAETIKEMCGNAEITNKTKLISFELDGENYELNLIRHRKPKKERI